VLSSAGSTSGGTSRGAIPPGGGLDEEQGLLPPLREAGGDDHPPPVGGRELWSADLAAQNEELLAKEGVRRHQLARDRTPSRTTP